MSAEELSKYALLPDNLPENKLKPKEIEFINDLYRRYIGQLIDNQKWDLPMYEVEQKEISFKNESKHPIVMTLSIFRIFK